MGFEGGKVEAKCTGEVHGRTSNARGLLGCVCVFGGPEGSDTGFMTLKFSNRHSMDTLSGSTVFESESKPDSHWSMKNRVLAPRKPKAAA